MKKTLKRLGIVLLVIFLVLIQITWISASWPWFQIVFIFLVIYSAYNRTAITLLPTAVGGALLEAFTITQTGMQFIAYVGSILLMLILGKTILSHVSVFSLAALVCSGTGAFMLLSYLQTLLTSAVFLHHPVQIHQPWALLGLFFLSVFIFFSIHAVIKAGLSRWTPSIHRMIYGNFV